MLNTNFETFIYHKKPIQLYRYLCVYGQYTHK